MTTAVIMVHYGQVTTTLESLKKLAPKLKAYPFILVNNTSTDLTSVKKIIPQTEIINNPKNLGFAKAVNLGINRAFKNERVDSIFLINNDLTLTFGTIPMLRKTLFQQPTHGIVAPVLYHHQLYDWGGRYNPWLGNARHQNFAQKPKRPLHPDHLAGAAMMIKRSLLEKIGLFDERFFLYFEDLDLCLRARVSGYQLTINPEVVAHHHVSSSSTPMSRTLHQWKSHWQFLWKHLPSFRVYPTALIYNLTFYPLITSYLLLKKVFTFLKS